MNVTHLECSLTGERYEAGQVKTLNTLEESYDGKARRMRNILADLGLDLGKITPALPPRATGGAVDCGRRPVASPCVQSRIRRVRDGGQRALQSIAGSVRRDERRP